MKIFTFDTTLRDGTQGEAVSFSVDDKLVIAQKLDDLGIDYIEGGWPGSNPKDEDFFARAKDITLNHAKLTAFGSTRFAKNPVEQDRNVRKLLDVLHALVEAGKTVLVIEHNLEVIKTADWIIDLGPEGGDAGGHIVATGTPEDIASSEASYTGQYLRPYLARRTARRRRAG